MKALCGGFIFLMYSGAVDASPSNWSVTYARLGNSARSLRRSDCRVRQFQRRIQGSVGRHGDIRKEGSLKESMTLWPHQSHSTGTVKRVVAAQALEIGRVDHLDDMVVHRFNGERQYLVPFHDLPDKRGRMFARRPDRYIGRGHRSPQRRTKRLREIHWNPRKQQARRMHARYHVQHREIRRLPVQI